uniref:Uncharacterized protein LOC105033555 n=1 Tax=Elaeis guineensis var. tenera TaxID=51953 RepID=A0A6I9QBR1_ELAGV|nr:uncharacterized protein LOC105033555 [Elaeis guineensis]
MAMAAGAWNSGIIIPRFSSSSLPRCRPPAKPSVLLDPKTPNICFASSWIQRRKTTPRSVCFSSRPDGRPEAEEGIEALDDALLSSDDFGYLWKLAAGSVGSGAAIKYGSIIFPEITRPNILQALLMVSLPVLVAVLILIKESRTESQREDLL